MNRNLSFIFVLLVILSIVNAIPHKLHKRVVNFGKCPQGGNLLAVAYAPDPLVPGGIANFTVSGEISPPAEANTIIGVVFLDPANNLLSTPIQIDLCTSSGVVCPISALNLFGSIQIPGNLPTAYTVVVGVVNAAGTFLGCAIASVDTAAPPPPPPPAPAPPA
jgi:hypothetical protein